jgi:choline dehydrogenase-like flavoprotein
MYYEPHASRSNLTVLTSAHVTRASLSQVASGEATAESVSFIYKGNEYRAFVKKEVIFSAGYAIRSPRCVSNMALTCIRLFQNNHVPSGNRASSIVGHYPS